MGRKLLPALFHLSEKGRLPRDFHVLGVSRGGGMTDQKFRQWARASLLEAGFSKPRIHQRWCDQCLHYQQLAGPPADAFAALGARLASLERTHSLAGNRIFYLALPPQAFAPTIEGLGQAG